MRPIAVDTNLKTYGEDVFSESAVRENLPKRVAEKLLATMRQSKPLDPTIADAVAEGVDVEVAAADPRNLAAADGDALYVTATEAMGGKYLTDCTLYVTVEPCPMCAGALAWSQISRIVYGAPDPRRGYSLFSPSLLHPRTEAASGVLADECAALVKDYFKSKR